MANSVAGQGAGGPACALVGIGDATASRRDVKGIEVDQMRLILNSMRRVTGGAGGLLVADVPAVEPIPHEDALTVAFVAQGVGRGVFRLVIHLVEVALKERGVGGAVRAIGPSTLGPRALVTVMAVRTEHLLGTGPGRNQGAILG